MKTRTEFKTSAFSRSGASWLTGAILTLGVHVCVLGALPVARAIEAPNKNIPRDIKKDAKADTTAINARQLAAAAVDNEIRVLFHPGMYLRYRMRKIDEKGDILRDVIETKDGTVARRIAFDGNPLTPAQNSAELDRIAAMISQPGDFARHQRRDQAEKEHAKNLLEMIPDGLLFSVASPQEPLPGDQTPDPKLVELNFKPNPNFKPPTIESQILGSMEGRVWIKADEQQIVRLEVHLISDAAFGWGLLGKVYRGGNVVLDQADAGDHHWIMTHLTQKLTVRALMVKTIHLDVQQDISHFEVLKSAMTYQDGIKLLESTPYRP